MFPTSLIWFHLCAPSMRNNDERWSPALCFNTFASINYHQRFNGFGNWSLLADKKGHAMKGSQWNSRNFWWKMTRRQKVSIENIFFPISSSFPVQKIEKSLTCWPFYLQNSRRGKFGTRKEEKREKLCVSTNRKKYPHTLAPEGHVDPTTVITFLFSWLCR